MIPLVGDVKELQLQADIVRRVATAVMAETGVRFKYAVGTMIEVPRGALTADAIAGVAEFFSFGTNDLTQMTLGVSRDDAARFLMPYVRDFEIYAKDPFESLDQVGVGGLMRIAVEQRPDDHPQAEDRHLRRARRRSRFGDVLPSHRSRLRVLFALPRADRPAGRGACAAVLAAKPKA